MTGKLWGMKSDMHYNDVRCLETVKYIFVDCFDTIIFRKCNSELVIQRWLQNIAQFFTIDVTVTNEIWKQLLKNRRINRRDTEEESFEIVCGFFYSRLKHGEYLSCTYEQFYEYVLNLMIEIEIAVQFRNEDMISLLAEGRKQGKKIVCVTDFYLPCSAIEKFFEHLDILNLFDDIFVSSEIGCRKSKGTLYRYIMDKLNCIPSDVVMIGDNRRSDYLIPKKLGILAYEYKGKNQVDAEPFVSFGENILKDEHEKYQNPFGVYAFSLYYFCEKLYNSLNAKGMKKVYFLSREGEPLKELFDYYVELQGVSEIETRYLYISRQSTYLPSLKPMGGETFESLRILSKDMSVLDFVDSIGLTEEVKHEIPEFYTKHVQNESIVDFFNSVEFAEVLNNEKFSVIYERKRTEAKQQALKYFAEEGIQTGDNVAIVDIGWKGTIQDNLYKIFDGEVMITGYYYGLLGDVRMNDGNQKYGLVFSDYPLKSQYFDTFKISYRFLENLLYASHGSCIGYLDGEALLDSYSEKERELYLYVRDIQIRIKELFKNIDRYVDLYHISNFEFIYSVSKLQMKYHLNLSRDTISKIEYLYDRLKLNFGKRSREKLNIRKLLQIVKNMSGMERCSKVLIQLEKRRMKKTASLMRKILLRMI